MRTKSNRVESAWNAIANETNVAATTIAIWFMVEGDLNPRLRDYPLYPNLAGVFLGLGEVYRESQAPVLRLECRLLGAKNKIKIWVDGGSDHKHSMSNLL